MSGGIIIADTRFTFHNIGQGVFYTGEIYFKLESDNDKIALLYLFMTVGRHQKWGILNML